MRQNKGKPVAKKIKKIQYLIKKTIQRKLKLKHKIIHKISHRGHLIKVIKQLRKKIKKLKLVRKTKKLTHKMVMKHHKNTKVHNKKRMRLVSKEGKKCRKMMKVVMSKLREKSKLIRKFRLVTKKRKPTHMLKKIHKKLELKERKRHQIKLMKIKKLMQSIKHLRNTLKKRQRIIKQLRQVREKKQPIIKAVTKYYKKEKKLKRKPKIQKVKRLVLKLMKEIKLLKLKLKTDRRNQKKLKLIRKQIIAKLAKRITLRVQKRLKRLAMKKIMKRIAIKKRRHKTKVKLIRKLQHVRKHKKPVMKIIKKLRHLKMNKKKHLIKKQEEWKIHNLSKLTLCKKKIQQLEKLVKKLKMKKREIHPRLTIKQIERQKVRLIKKLKLAKKKSLPVTRIIKKLKHLEVMKVHKRPTLKQKKIKLLKKLKLAKKLKKPTTIILKKLRNLKVKRIHRVPRLVQTLMKEIKSLKQKLKIERRKEHKLWLIHKQRLAKLTKRITLRVQKKMKKLAMRKILRINFIKKRTHQKKLKLIRKLQLARKHKMPVTTIIKKLKRLKIKRSKMHLKQKQEQWKTDLLKEVRLSRRKIQKLKNRIKKLNATNMKIQPRITKKQKARQKMILIKQLKLAKKKNLPVTRIVKKLKHLERIEVHKKPQLIQKKIKLLKKLKSAKKLKKPTTRILKKLRHLKAIIIHKQVKSKEKKLCKLNEAVRQKVKLLKKKLVYEINKEKEISRQEQLKIAKIKRQLISKLKKNEHQAVKNTHPTCVIPKDVERLKRIIKLLRQELKRRKPLINRKLVLITRKHKIRKLLKKLRTARKKKKPTVKLIRKIMQLKLKLPAKRHVAIIKNLKKHRLKTIQKKLVTKRLERKKVRLLKKLRIARKEKKPTLQIIKKLTQMRRKTIALHEKRVKALQDLNETMVKEIEHLNDEIRKLHAKHLRKCHRQVTIKQWQKKKPVLKILKKLKKQKILSRKKILRRLTLKQRKVLTTRLLKELRLAKREKRPTTRIVRHLEQLAMMKETKRYLTVKRVRRRVEGKELEEPEEREAPEERKNHREEENPEELTRENTEGKELKKEPEKYNEGVELQRPIVRVEKVGVGRNRLYMTQYRTRKEVVVYETSYSCNHGYRLRSIGKDKVICYRVIQTCKEGYELIQKPEQKPLCHKKIPRCPKGYELRSRGGMSLCYKKHPSCPPGYKFNHTPNMKADCLKTVITCKGGFVKKTRGGETICVKKIPKCKSGYKLVKQVIGPAKCHRNVPKCPQKYQLNKTKENTLECIQNVPICGDGFTLQKQGETPICTKTVKEKQITQPPGHIVFRKKPKDTDDFVTPLENEISVEPKEVVLKRSTDEAAEEVKPVIEDRMETPEPEEETVAPNILRKPVVGREQVVTSGHSPLKTVQTMERFRKVAECDEGYNIIKHGDRKECVRCPDGFNVQHRDGYIACFKTILKCMEGYKPTWKNGKGLCVKKIPECSEGFELTQEGALVLCMKRAPPECRDPRNRGPACSKTVHSCPSGYQLSGKDDFVVCVKKLLVCVKGYQIKRKASETSCVKSIPACSQGFSLVKRQGVPVCAKKRPTCSDGYELRDNGAKPVCAKKFYTCQEGCDLAKRGGKMTCIKRKTEIPEEPKEVPASVVEVTIQPEENTVFSDPRTIEIDTRPVKIDVDRVPAIVRSILLKDKTRKPRFIEVKVAPFTQTVTLPVEIHPVRKLKTEPKLMFQWMAPKLYATIYPFFHPMTKTGAPVPVQVIFVIDNSKDIKRKEFGYIRRFLQVLITKPRPNWKITRFGVITTSNKPEVVFGLSPRRRLKRLMSRLRLVKGVANLAGALELASEMFDNHPCKTARNVAIILSANSPSLRQVSRRLWDDLMEKGVATLTISAGKGPYPVFYHHLKRSKLSDVLLLPSFNLLPSFHWHLKRGDKPRVQKAVNVSSKEHTKLKSFVTSFTCRPGYSLRYGKGIGPSCFRNVKKLVMCPRGYEITGGKSAKCLKKEKKCPDGFNLKLNGELPLCVKKTSSCSKKHKLVPLKGGNFVCVEQVPKCAEGYRLRLTEDRKTECLKTIYACNPGFNLEERPGEKPACVKQLTIRKCDVGYWLKQHDGISVCIRLTKEHSRPVDSQGLIKEELPEVKGIIVVEKHIRRPADKRKFARGPRDAVEIIKPKEHMEVKEPREVTVTKEPVDVKKGDETASKDHRRLARVVEETAGVIIIKRPVVTRTKVFRDEGPPVEVVTLGKRLQVRPMTGEITQCPDGFQAKPNQNGETIRCVRQCTKPACYRTVHECHDGYTFDVARGICIRSKLKCTNGYRLKMNEDKPVCVKEITDCDNGYELDKSGKKPICTKNVPSYCRNGYKLRERGSEKQCVKKVYSCTGGFRLTTKEGKRVCSMKRQVLTCSNGYELKRKNGKKPHCAKVSKPGKGQQAVTEPVLATVEKYKKASVTEVTIQPEERTLLSTPRNVDVETVPIQVILDSAPAKVEKVRSDVETAQPRVVTVDMKPINETAEQSVVPMEEGNFKRQSALTYLFGETPVDQQRRRILDMSLENFLKRFGQGKKQKVMFEGGQGPYHWSPLKLHRPRSEGSMHTEHEETHHTGPWYLFSRDADHKDNAVAKDTWEKLYDEVISPRK